jgi:hypothetical protein
VRPFSHHWFCAGAHGQPPWLALHAFSMATRSRYRGSEYGYGGSIQQACQGRNGDSYESGRDSAAGLREMTRDRRVECKERDRDRYGRIVAICNTESGELNAAMIRRGWAVDYTR